MKLLVGAILVQTHVNINMASDGKLVGFNKNPRRRRGEGLQPRERP
jgi:hypothetical protein